MRITLGALPNTESWHSWHIPEIKNSLYESASVKAPVGSPHVGQSPLSLSVFWAGNRVSTGRVFMNSPFC